MEGGANGGGRTIRVLHAEDDDAFRDLVAGILSAEEDILVVSEATPESALERLRSERFDCVISDYDGDDEAAFLPVIEATEGGPPCILLTAKEREKVDPAATAGIDEYLRKGARNGRFGVLAERIRNHAERYWAAERHRALFEDGSGPMVVHDAGTGQVIDVNPSFVELLGYDREQASTMEMAEFMPDEGPHSPENARELVERAAEGETITAEWVNVTADGDRIPVEVRLNRMDVAGHGRIAVTVRDIRERKRREVELDRHRNNLERLHSAAQRLLGAETHEQVYDVTVDAAESVLSPASCTVAIHDDDTFYPVATGGEEAADPPEPFPTGGIEQRALETGETQVGNDGGDPILCVPIDGHGVLWLRGYGPDQDSARELAEVLTSHAAVALDRADRESELQADHQRIESLAAAFPDYAFFYDADGVYKEVWLASGRDTEMNVTGDLIGKSVHDVLDEETATTVQETIDAVLATGEVKEVEYAVSGPAGTYWYEARVAPLPEEMDDGSEVVLVARDVTTRHEYEQQLERQNERLDEFASLVSHDLRNPLNVVQGRLDLVASTTDDEAVREHAESAAAAAERMNDLIDDMLTVARTDEQDLTLSSVDIGEAAARAWSAVSDSGATLDVAVETPVRADETKLIRLLENLFRNAVEHGSAVEDRGSDSGLTVRIERTDGGFAVADDGPGIPEEYRESVFESGFSTASEGTGYGLDIVERIADAHGWSVSLAESDSGARFEVTGVTFLDGDESASGERAT